MHLTVGWSGPAPRGALLAALRAAGIEVRTRGQSPVRVVCARRRPPAAAGRWIWLPDQRVAAAAETEAVLAGAYDVIPRSAPDAAPRLIARLREACAAPAAVPDTTLIAESEVTRSLLAQLAVAARTSMPVLLTGETGTGKEVCARLLHAWSRRAGKAFIPIDCAAIPNELMEAELFGYARGAFSGAVQDFDGQLAAAEGGTVFLDEIDDSPLPTQAKLLRVLEDRVVRRIGESVPRTVDFRLIAATNRDLRPLIASGAFLPDLYERLAIVAIDLPPLRARLADLPALVAQLIARFYREEPGGRDVPVVERVSAPALAALAAYPWPGNVRELRNVIFQTLVYKRAGDEILLADLPRRVIRRDGAAPPAGGERPVVDAAAVAARVDGGTMNLRAEVDALERIALDAALARAGGNATRAAELLGAVGRGRSRDPGNTVRAMMRRHRRGGV